MPRVAREKSSTGIYHVMLRGINHQIIFEDDEDCQKYLDTLKAYQEESGYTVYAWCLMGNYLHLGDTRGRFFCVVPGTGHKGTVLLCSTRY